MLAKAAKGRQGWGRLGKKILKLFQKGKAAAREESSSGVQPLLSRSSPGLSVLAICTRFLCFPYPGRLGERKERHHEPEVMLTRSEQVGSAQNQAYLPAESEDILIPKVWHRYSQLAFPSLKWLNVCPSSVFSFLSAISIYLTLKYTK